ncbi:virulence protein MsgA [Erwinia typographi]|uniref:Virulence protein MsgA n=1 Tax=Erwinia typographi TaxID=371042 RepID=A0A0A3ZQU3_9GAMM|nr:DinI-like family protein [Erwinia typographi]KGT88048.1 virulence protein MsgA [Erwinia typographi]
MYVELIYDKRNVEGLPNASELIRSELEKRVHRIFPNAVVRVKPMMSNSSINTDASKGDKAKLQALLEEMFEEADMWMVNDL